MKDIKLTSFDEIFGSDTSESSSTNQTTVSDITMVPINSLHPFKNHPFHVNDDEEMDTLVQSIIDNNNELIEPILVRKDETGYEIISGHRRKRACEILNFTEVPVRIRDYNDNEATIVMTAANTYRENILPSEKAKSYALMMNAIKAENRNAETRFPNSLEASIHQRLGLSKQMVNKTIKLNDLIPDLMHQVDVGFISMKVGYQLAFLKENEQLMLLNLLDEKRTRIDEKKAIRLKELSEKRNLTEQKMKLTLYGEIKQKRSVSINDKKLKEYFPDTYTKADIEETIYSLLEEWKQQNEKENVNED